jgi:hypothetical protein
MFAQIFESESPVYLLPSERDGIPGFVYNAYLITPPRIYSESFVTVRAMFVKKEQTQYSDFTIYVMGVMDQIYFPSYSYVTWRFDGVTGAYLDRDDNLIGSLFDYQITQARDGALWQASVLGDIYEIDPLTFVEIPGTRQTPSHFGSVSMHLPLVDRALDLIIMVGGNESPTQIGVYEFTSGTHVRSINVSGTPAQIFPEDNKRCYVLCSNYLLNLVDYTTGEVLSTLRAPGTGTVATLGSGYQLAWDRFFRRILLFTLRDDDTDGACLSTLSGYYPVPLGVAMTPPIPIKAPRAGRTTPFLCRVYGDVGEGVTGAKVTPTVGTASLTGAPPFTDSDGEAIISLIPDAAGSDTLTVSATV